jgi:hypothetical protein
MSRLLLLGKNISLGGNTLENIYMNETKPDKLLDCPFCGWHTPSLKYAGMARYRVQCPGCGGSGGTCKDMSAAERQWNTRADQQHKHSEHNPEMVEKILAAAEEPPVASLKSTQEYKEWQDGLSKT